MGLSDEGLSGDVDGRILRLQRQGRYRHCNHDPDVGLSREVVRCFWTVVLHGIRGLSTCRDTSRASRRGRGKDTMP